MISTFDFLPPVFDAMNVDFLAPLLALKGFVTETIATFAREAPSELMKWFLVPLIGTGLVSVWLYVRRRTQLSVRAASRIVRAKGVGVSVEIHRFVHDHDREFEGSVFTKVSAMFYSWNDEKHADVVSVQRSEAIVRVTNISQARSYVLRQGRASGLADVEIFGWHARSGATGSVIMLDRSGGVDSGKLEIFSFGDQASEELFEARIYEAISRSVAVKYKASEAKKWSLVALRAARSNAEILRNSALRAGQEKIAKEANVLQMNIRDEIGHRSVDLAELQGIAAEMSESLGDWQSYFEMEAELAQYSLILYKLSYLDSDLRALYTTKRNIHRAITQTLGSENGLHRGLFLPYLMVCAALFPFVGNSHTDLDPIDPGLQFAQDVEIAAWIVCAAIDMPKLFILSEGYYPLLSIKAAIDCLPPWAANSFFDQLFTFYLDGLRRMDDPELVRVLTRACQLLPTSGDRIANHLNRTVRCFVFRALAQEADAFGESPDELRTHADTELRRLVVDIRLEEMNLNSLYGFKVFGLILNPIILSDTFESKQKIMALGRGVELDAACSIFVGLSRPSLSNLVSALNNMAEITGNIDFAEQALSILDTKRIEPSFHTTYLRAYCLVRCVRLANDPELGRYAREAKKVILKLRTLALTRQSEYQMRTIAHLSGDLGAALSARVS